MVDATVATAPVPIDVHAPTRPKLDVGFNPRTTLVFFSVLACGFFFVAYSIYSDVSESGVRSTSWLPFVLLGVALFIALGFEFVNGFHDTANAVATVIYTHSLPAHLAVVWSGVFNFLGVMASSGAVAYGIIALLPVELILQVGSSAGFAMVFALLIGAIAWNLGTWYLGLPASSSHTLIGSIIGVGLANQMMSSGGASGVDWAQASKIGYSLLLSPLIGFCAAALLLLGLKLVARRPELYSEPKGAAPPPLWIRGILILTCTGRQLRARVERRPEGHGADHADPDRRRADRLRAQPRRAGQRHPTVPADVHLRRTDAGPICGWRAPSTTHGALSATICARARRIRTWYLPSRSCRRTFERRWSSTDRSGACRRRPCRTFATTCISPPKRFDGSARIARSRSRRRTPIC